MSFLSCFSRTFCYNQCICPWKGAVMYLLSPLGDVASQQITGEVNWPPVRFLGIKYLKYDNEWSALLNCWWCWNERSWIHQSRVPASDESAWVPLTNSWMHFPWPLPKTRCREILFPEEGKRKRIGEEFARSRMLHKIDSLIHVKHFKVVSWAHSPRNEWQLCGPRSAPESGFGGCVDPHSGQLYIFFPHTLCGQLYISLTLKFKVTDKE